MQRVVVHRCSGAVQIQVSFESAQVVVNPEPEKPIAAVATRIGKKMQQKEIVFLDANGGAIAGDCAMLQTGHVLKVGNYTLPVFVNPPTVRDLSLPAYPLVGLPMMPNMALENAEAASWRWFRGDLEVGRERHYVPDVNDVGCKLSVECTPIPHGMKASVESDVVSAAPQFSGSMRPGAMHACGDFRVLSFNLLADYNLKPDLARGDPDYLHLRPEEKDFQYRRQLLLREIVGFGSHIICLQEVDRDTMYENFLHDQLGHLGYNGVYANKVHTTTPVGNAIFWQSQTWRLLTSEVLDLTQGEAIQSLLEASPSLGFAMSKTTTVANLVVLEDAAKRRLVVANVHLFGDPSAPHIRLLQTYLVLCEAQRHSAPLLLCGDLNCGPEAGVCELLTVGFVDEEHPDWASGRTFQWGSLCDKRVDPASIPQDQWCASMSLSHPFRLGTVGMPDYTFWNGQTGYVVDHIFVDTAALRVESTLPVPAIESIRELGVASSAFPSDHVAVVADLGWNEQDV